MKGFFIGLFTLFFGLFILFFGAMLFTACVLDSDDSDYGSDYSYEEDYDDYEDYEDEEDYDYEEDEEEDYGYEEDEEEDEENSVSIGQEKALNEAQSFVDFTDIAPGQLERLLKDFTEEEINYAVENVEVDWKEEALERAQSFIEHTDSPRAQIERILLKDGFSKEQVDYALKNSWDKQ